MTTTKFQTPASSPALDEARVEAFAERLVEHLGSGALTLMISIGHRTGLFDAMRGLPPATSAEIAAAAGLHERYVRECLSSLAAGAVVEYDPAADTFWLPPEHAVSLTRNSGRSNVAVATQFLGVVGGVESDIVECFRTGGGVGYERYHRFHEVMAEESEQTVVANLRQRVLPLVPGLDQRLSAGIDVLDVGCGRGRALARLATLFPASRFRGYDLCEEAIVAARAFAAEQGLTNVTYEVRDVTTLPAGERYDLVTAFDAIHDQAHPDRVLQAIAGALRPGGTFLMQDIHASSRLADNLDHPAAAYLYAISCLHCTPVSLAQGGQGLGTVWGQERARALLAAAGFGDVAIHAIEDDPLNDYYVCRRA